MACCDKCPCSEEAYVTRREGSYKYAIVVDSPSESEVKADTWLAGKRGGAPGLFRALLENFEHPEDVYVTSAVNCHPNPKKKAMQKNCMLACAERLVDELLLV